MEAAPATGLDAILHLAQEAQDPSSEACAAIQGLLPWIGCSTLEELQIKQKRVSDLTKQARTAHLGLVENRDRLKEIDLAMIAAAQRPDLKEAVAGFWDLVAESDSPVNLIEGVGEQLSQHFILPCLTTSDGEAKDILEAATLQKDVMAKELTAAIRKHAHTDDPILRYASARAALIVPSLQRLALHHSFSGQHEMIRQAKAESEALGKKFDEEDLRFAQKRLEEWTPCLRLYRHPTLTTKIDLESPDLTPFDQEWLAELEAAGHATKEEKINAIEEWAKTFFEKANKEYQPIYPVDRWDDGFREHLPQWEIWTNRVADIRERWGDRGQATFEMNGFPDPDALAEAIAITPYDQAVGTSMGQTGTQFPFGLELDLDALDDPLATFHQRLLQSDQQALEELQALAISNS